MTDRGTHLVVDAAEKPLEDLLDIVRNQGRLVQICVAGEPVAELSPMPVRRPLPPVDPRLKPTIVAECGAVVAVTAHSQRPLRPPDYCDGAGARVAGGDARPDDPALQ